jgi:hypothetical protein
MRELITFIISWLAVTTVFVITFAFDGLELSFSGLNNTLMLWVLVGLVAGLYFIVVGLPILYFLVKRKAVTRGAFLLAGFIACTPMLIFCIVSRELEWVVASIVAGFVGGFVFAVRLPNQQGT